MSEGSRTSETDFKQLYERFHQAYRELREAWVKTGGDMEMEITIRDAAAEAQYQRRSAAAKKGGAKRRARRG